MKHLYIPVGNQKIKATLFYPENIQKKNPGVLFIHGWSSGEERYVKRAKSVSSKGAVCLTISLRGHDGSDGKLSEFSRADHLQDVIAAYDFLVAQKKVDPNRIGVCGLSYGGYMAAMLTAKRKIRWLILKSAALYKNENFTLSTVKVLEKDPTAMSKYNLPANDNYALKALSNFKKDILIVESEDDKVVTHETTLNYLEALKNKKITHTVMYGADHTLATEKWKQEFIDIITKWFGGRFSEMQKKETKISYEASGVDYESLDPAKTLAQKASKETAIHLKDYGFSEISDSRGESAFVWKQKGCYMASVTESLGTKNLVADAMRVITGKTYYDSIGYDTVASALNDIASVGAKPLVVTAFWAVGKSSWFDDVERTTDLVNGWRQACDDAGATWGGGESPSYNNIVNPEAIALGGNVVGIIPTQKRIMQDKKITSGDRILFLKSTGINANGISLARAVAKKLPKGYATKLADGSMFGEAILRKTNIYAQLIQDLLDANINLHYISNITGHGLRKVMRGRGDFTYVIEKLFKPQVIFDFLQEQTGMSDHEIYETYNMGQDYALFLPEKDIKQSQKIVKNSGFESLDAGYVKKGERQVIIEPKNITFKGESLKVRI